MNKTIIAGLAGTSIVLAIALAFILGGQYQAYEQQNLSAQAQWGNTMMGNRTNGDQSTQYGSMKGNRTYGNQSTQYGSMMGNRAYGNTSNQYGMMGGQYGNFDYNNQYGMMGGRFADGYSSTDFNEAMQQRMFAYTSDLSTSLEGTDYDLASMEAMLKILIADEYKARSFYTSMVNQYGESSPWSQLILAETQHISTLTQLFEAYGLNVPADASVNNATTASLDEAYAIGVTAEEENLALYEGYLATDLPEQVEAVFTHFLSASNRHLDTLEAYASGQTSTFRQGMMGRWGY